MKQKVIDENLQFIQFYGLNERDVLEANCPLGYTHDHVDFILRQHESMKERSYLNIKTAIDHKKYQHFQELTKLRKSIE